MAPRAQPVLLLNTAQRTDLCLGSLLTPPPVTLEIPHSPLQLASEALIRHRHRNGLLIQSRDGLDDIYVPQSLSIFPSPYFPYFLDKEPPPQDKTCNRLVDFEPPKPFGRFLDPLWKQIVILILCFVMMAQDLQPMEYQWALTAFLY